MRSGELFSKKRCVERWSLAPCALIYCRPTLHEWIGSCKHFKLRRVRHYGASQPSVVKNKLVSKIYRITFIIKLSILNRSSPNVKKNIWKFNYSAKPVVNTEQQQVRKSKEGKVSKSVSENRFVSFPFSFIFSQIFSVIVKKKTQFIWRKIMKSASN